MGDRRRRGRGLERGDLRPARSRIKDAQLCAEVRETISLVLAQSDDERLLSLAVIDVVPAPDASRLAVQIETDELDVEEARALLERAAARLRAEVASSIHRKKAPTLVFDVRPRGAP